MNRSTDRHRPDLGSFWHRLLIAALLAGTGCARSADLRMPNPALTNPADRAVPNGEAAGAVAADPAMAIPPAIANFSATASPTVMAIAERATRPLYYARPLLRPDLDGRTLRELSLMRNWIFARSGQTFRRRWIREFFEGESWYAPVAGLGLDQLPALDRQNAELIGRAELAIPRSSLLERRDTLREQASLSGEDQIELELLGERLGEAIASSGPVSPLQDPDLLERQLTLDQLADFSRRDLLLLKSLVEARRGREFASEFLGQYFARFEWYRPDPRYTADRLTELDRRNLTLLRSLEHELGGPLAEDEEGLWFGFA